MQSLLRPWDDASYVAKQLHVGQLYFDGRLDLRPVLLRGLRQRPFRVVLALVIVAYRRYNQVPLPVGTRNMYCIIFDKDKGIAKTIEQNSSAQWSCKIRTLTEC